MLGARFFVVVHTVCATFVAIALLIGSRPGLIPGLLRSAADWMESDGGGAGGGDDLTTSANSYNQDNKERWAKLQHVDNGKVHANAPQSGLVWAEVLHRDKWVAGEITTAQRSTMNLLENTDGVHRPL